MNKLNIENINEHSPYDVEEAKGRLFFKTSYGITYVVDFEEEPNQYYTAYWFNLTNTNNVPSPGDKKIAQTVICIIEEFFRQNPDILLYFCSTADGKQAQRARLFLRWFNGAEQQKQYLIRAAEVRGEGRMEYVALIAQRNNPNINDIIEFFDSEIAMFNEFKP